MEKSAISLLSDAGVIRRLDLGPFRKHDTCDHGNKATGIVRARKKLPQLRCMSRPGVSRWGGMYAACMQWCKGCCCGRGI